MDWITEVVDGIGIGPLIVVCILGFLVFKGMQGSGKKDGNSNSGSSTTSAPPAATNKPQPPTPPAE